MDGSVFNVSWFSLTNPSNIWLATKYVLSSLIKVGWKCCNLLGEQKEKAPPVFGVVSKLEGVLHELRMMPNMTKENL